MGPKPQSGLGFRVSRNDIYIGPPKIGIIDVLEAIEFFVFWPPRG